MTLKSDFIVVPRIVLSDKDLNNTDKLLLGLIVSLTFKENYCYASNNYLANNLNASKRTINYSLSNLKEKDYIIIKYDKDKRKIYLNENKILTNNSISIANNGKTSDDTNCKYNIKSNNKKDNYIPKWILDPNLCNDEECNEEELKELNDLLNEFKS